MPNYKDYGRIGGLQTLVRYGKAHFSQIGRIGAKGGRPRLRQLPSPQSQDNGKGGLPNSLKGLKELWKQRRD